MGTSEPVVAIVGGGVAGLAAAFFLRQARLRVIVLEGSPRLGGKLAVSEVGGVAVDEGAEALLARRPEGIGLIRAVGLAGELAAPATTAAAIWSRGSMRRLPRRQFMGVPADLDDLAGTGLLSAAGLALARRDLDRPAPPRTGAVAVASFVADRFGHEVVERLVDPLLGGVYAGRSEELSFEATLPALAAQSRRHASLAAAASALLAPEAAGPEEEAAGAEEDPAPGAGAGPVSAQGDALLTPGDAPGPHGLERPQVPQAMFATLRRGLGTLPEALVAASGATVRTSAMVRELARTPAGWRLTVGSAHAPASLAADAVVLALPAQPAARLLAGLAGASAARVALAGITYASMAIVTLAYRPGAFGDPLAGSGYLVPAVDGHPVKAVTYSSVKWPHLGQAGLVIVRCSVGRLGEEGLLQREDADLAALAAADFAAATGVRGQPACQRVTRWGGALPQYTVGHLSRVATIRADVARQPGLAVCGAAYDGLGIPACIASARSAADHILAYLAERRPLPQAR